MRRTPALARDGRRRSTAGTSLKRPYPYDPGAAKKLLADAGYPTASNAYGLPKRSVRERRADLPGDRRDARQDRHEGEPASRRPKPSTSRRSSRVKMGTSFCHGGLGPRTPTTREPAVRSLILHCRTTRPGQVEPRPVTRTSANRRAVYTHMIQSEADTGSGQAMIRRSRQDRRGRDRPYIPLHQQNAGLGRQGQREPGPAGHADNVFVWSLSRADEVARLGARPACRCDL